MTILNVPGGVFDDIPANLHGSVPSWDFNSISNLHWVLPLRLKAYDIPIFCLSDSRSAFLLLLLVALPNRLVDIR